MSEVLSFATLRTLVDQWIADGRRVAGPRLVNDRLLYAWLDSAGQLALDGPARPRNSIKEFLFPRHEKLYGYKLGRKRGRADRDSAAAGGADRRCRPAVRRRVGSDPRSRLQLGLRRRHLQSPPRADDHRYPGLPEL